MHLGFRDYELADHVHEVVKLGGVYFDRPRFGEPAPRLDIRIRLRSTCGCFTGRRRRIGRFGRSGRGDNRPPRFGGCWWSGRSRASKPRQQLIAFGKRFEGFALKGP